MTSLAPVRYPTPAHAALADRVLRALRADERVLAVFVGGSVATNDADEESDLDLTVAVDDAVVESFWGQLRQWFESVGRPVVVAPGPVPHLLTALMHDGLRVDVTVEARSVLASRPRRPMIALHDPLGTSAEMAFASPRFEATSEWLSRHATDFLRFLDQLNVVVVRREWIAGIDNAWYLISRLLELYAHVNGAPRTSARRVNARLTPEQRSAVESLPPIHADEAAVVAVHLAVARLYRVEGRALADELGGDWPFELETAVLDHLRRRTGTDFSP